MTMNVPQLLIGGPYSGQFFEGRMPLAWEMPPIWTSTNPTHPTPSRPRYGYAGGSPDLVVFLYHGEEPLDHRRVNSVQL